jgi:phosphatidylserine decarboxylase
MSDKITKSFILYLISISIILYLILILFNRSPDRITYINKNIIVSPCDGTVTYSNGRYISVFLSPLNVHVQYAPIDSTIIDIQIVNNGVHLMATKPESSHNEGIRVTFGSKLGNIVVTQRVGFFVRRIINNINIGNNVGRSYKYGFITFGSRVDIILPPNYSSILKVGDKLIGGFTPIINFNL